MESSLPHPPSACFVDTSSSSPSGPAPSSVRQRVLGAGKPGSGSPEEGRRVSVSVIAGDVWGCWVGQGAACSRGDQASSRWARQGEYPEAVAVLIHQGLA